MSEFAHTPSCATGIAAYRVLYPPNFLPFFCERCCFRSMMSEVTLSIFVFVGLGERRMAPFCQLQFGSYDIGL